MNIPNILKDYKDRFTLREDGGTYYLIMPFFYPRESESITLKLYQEGGSLFLSDSGHAYERLLNRYVDTESDTYIEYIEKIKKRFYITENDGHEFILEFPSDDKNSIHTFIGFFIQAISVIGNLDLFN